MKVKSKLWPNSAFSLVHLQQTMYQALCYMIEKQVNTTEQTPWQRILWPSGEYSQNKQLQSGAGKYSRLWGHVEKHQC